MRRAAGCTNHLARCLALLALAACGVTPAPALQHITAERCELAENRERAADSAILAIRAPGAGRNDCALRLAAASLRPWAGGPLEPWTIAIATSAPSDTLDVIVTARRLRTAQARDALEAESVLVATEDLELVEYARARDDLEVVALPWDRLYLYVGTPWDASLGALDPVTVGAEARRAQPLPECDPLWQLPQPRAIARSSRAVYLLGDRIGRELAERIVGLGHAREVVGLDSTAFDAALSVGAEEAFIASIPLSGDLCGERRALRRRAPWADRLSITPLVETRAYAITRPGNAP